MFNISTQYKTSNQNNIGTWNINVNVLLTLRYENKDLKYTIKLLDEANNFGPIEL